MINTINTIDDGSFLTSKSNFTSGISSGTITLDTSDNYTIYTPVGREGYNPPMTSAQIKAAGLKPLMTVIREVFEIPKKVQVRNNLNKNGDRRLKIMDDILNITRQQVFNLSDELEKYKYVVDEFAPSFDGAVKDGYIMKLKKVDDD